MGLIVHLTETRVQFQSNLNRVSVKVEVSLTESGGLCGWDWRFSGVVLLEELSAVGCACAILFNVIARCG